MTQHNFLECFDDYIGIPYKEPDKEGPGLNCWELVEKVMIEVYNITPPTINYTAPASHAAPVFMTNILYWERVQHEERRPGDLIMLHIRNMPLHCGIMISKDEMIHSLRGRNSCIESIFSIQWAKRIGGFYRWVN